MTQAGGPLPCWLARPGFPTIDDSSYFVRNLEPRRLMPAVYDKLGIRFMYPDNWILDESEALEGNRSVTVYSPGAAFWSIVLYGPDANPADLASEALRSLKAEYEESEAEPASDEIAEHTLKGYDLNFFLLDLTNTALIRSFHLGDNTCLVLCQSEDRELVTAGPVFRAITTSLLTSTPGEA